MMLPDLDQRAAARAEALAEAHAEPRRQALIRQIIARAPKFVVATDLPQGVLLTGRGLRRRFLRSAALRNFWR